MNAKNIRIAITQRVLENGPGGYRYDVLAQSWSTLLQSCGLSPVLVPNTLGNPQEFFETSGAEGIILSGGNNLSSPFTSEFSNEPDVAAERDRTEFGLLGYACQNKIPTIGICRGMQALNLFHGGRTAKISGHAGTTHQTNLGSELAAFLGSVSLETNSFHNFGIREQDLAAKCIALATTNDGSVEAMRHESLPQFGIMWHPEREPLHSPVHILLFRKILGLG